MDNKEIRLLLLIKGAKADRWRRALKKYEKEGIKVVDGNSSDPASAEIHYAIIEPYDDLLDKALKVKGLRYLVSVWAGVDVYVERAQDLGGIKVLRAVGKGLQQGMVDYVVGMSLAMALDLYGMRDKELSGEWQHSDDRRSVSSYEVCVLGIGKMGRVVAEGLRDAGFSVRGYARQKKEIDGIPCFAEGALGEAVRGVDIVVCLLPLNSETKGVLGARVFELMARGGFVINAGRGGHVDKMALLAALDSGQLSRAVLDVFDLEPLPAGDIYWQRKDIVVTPHIASATIPEDALVEGIKIIKTIEANPDVALEDLLGTEIIFDMKRGY